MNFRKVRVFLAVGLIALAGCVDEPSPTDPSSPNDSVEPSANMVPLDQSVERGHEAPFHKISQEVKGFGGYFYDEEGNLVAYLVDPDEEGRARALLDRVLAERDLSQHERSTGEIIFRKADYSFLELSGWRDRATHPVLDIKGVAWTDLDETQNRFVVGVTNPDARREVLEALRRQDVPLEPVLFEESGRAIETLTLKDYHRPLEGGFQIQRSGGGTCTLGFNAYWGGLQTFLTNSHCTSSVWQMQATSIYQNSASSSEDYVGGEIHDPSPWSCGAFNLYKCRWSDAAVIYKSWSAKSNYGKIARTSFWGYGPGNSGAITVSPSNPSMTIIGEYSFPTGGEMFDKMGRTTGWTYGYVTKTCVDMIHPTYTGGVGIILCQDLASYHNDGGDSGSPVFRWYGDTVRLAGLNWGNIPIGGTTHSIFSAMWNIEHDLGSLTTF